MQDTTYAVVPPDFLLAIWAPLVWFIWMILVWWSAFLMGLKKLAQTFYHDHLHAFKVWWTCILWSLVCMIAVTLLLTPEFSGHRLQLIYEENNNWHAIEIQLSAYEILPRYFQHQYTIVYLNEIWDSYTDSTSFTRYSPKFTGSEFIIDHSHENNPHTMEESRWIRFTINDSVHTIQLDDMQWDFLINNAPSRFTYMNFGKSSLRIDWNEVDATYSLNQKHSSNFRNIQRYWSLWAQSSVWFLVDPTNHITYFDVSDVPENDTDYQSHAWALSKSWSQLAKSRWQEYIQAKEYDNHREITLDEFYTGAQSHTILSTTAFNNNRFYLTRTGSWSMLDTDQSIWFIFSNTINE